MEKFKKNMKELSGQYESSDEEENEGGLEGEDIQDNVNNDKHNEEYEEWEGFNDDCGEGEEGTEEDKANKAKGILKRIYAAQANEDEGTEVTIEDVEMNNNLEEIAKLNYVNLQKSKKVLDESIDRAKKYAVIAGASSVPKKNVQKKKKFRYLTKTERRANNRKARDNKRKSRDKS